MLYIFVRIRKIGDVFAQKYCQIRTFAPCTYPVRIYVFVRIVSICPYLHVYKYMSLRNTYIYVHIRTICAYTDIHAYRYKYVHIMTYTYNTDIYVHTHKYIQYIQICAYTYNTYIYLQYIQMQSYTWEASTCQSQDIYVNIRTYTGHMNIKNEYVLFWTLKKNVRILYVFVNICTYLRTYFVKICPYCYVLHVFVSIDAPSTFACL